MSASPVLLSIGDFVEFVDLSRIRATAASVDVGSDKARWYCAVTNPNCQKRAELELYELGFRTFAPKLRKWVSHARVRKAVERPVLGRYLFVEVDHPRQSFGAVRAVNGIEGLVSNPDPVPIPSMFITRFRERYMAGEWDFVRTETDRPVFAWDEEKGRDVIVAFEKNAPIPIGARIAIIEGEFAKLLATITQRKGGNVTAKIMGENRYVKLNVCSVRAA